MTDNMLSFIFVVIFGGSLIFAWFTNSTMKWKTKAKKLERSNRHIVQRTEMIASNLGQSLEEARARVEKLEKEAGKRKPKPQCKGKRIIEI